MPSKWRRAGGLVALTAVLATAGCTSAETTGSSAPGTGTAKPPGEYGQPLDPAAPNPTDVAVDTPVTVAPGADLSLVVTYSDWNADTSAVEAGAFVPGVVESGGTCTLTLTQGGSTVTATAPGDPEASQTTCGALSIPGSEVFSGMWRAVVSYESDTSQATSDGAEVAVP